MRKAEGPAWPAPLVLVRKWSLPEDGWRLADGVFIGVFTHGDLFGSRWALALVRHRVVGERWRTRLGRHTVAGAIRAVREQGAGICVSGSITGRRLFAFWRTLSSERAGPILFDRMGDGH